MARYQVGVYVQYDESVEVEADSPEEACLLAEEEVKNNVSYCGSVDINASEAEELD